METQETHQNVQPVDSQARSEILRAIQREASGHPGDPDTALYSKSHLYEKGGHTKGSAYHKTSPK